MFLSCYRAIVLLLPHEATPIQNPHGAIPNQNLLEAVRLSRYRVIVSSPFHRAIPKQNLNEAVRLSCYRDIVLSYYCLSCIIEYFGYRVIVLTCYRVLIVL